MTTHPYYRLATVAAVVFIGLLGAWGDPLAAAGIALAATGFVAFGEGLRWIGL